MQHTLLPPLAAEHAELAAQGCCHRLLPAVCCVEWLPSAAVPHRNAAKQTAWPVAHPGNLHCNWPKSNQTGACASSAAHSTASLVVLQYAGW